MKDQVQILGTMYRIKKLAKTSEVFANRDGYVGFCDGNIKEIQILDLSTDSDYKYETDKYIAAQEKQTLKHEIVHGFFEESGLSYCSLQHNGAWAKNEEMIDWIAMQGEKIYKAWAEAGAI